MSEVLRKLANCEQITDWINPSDQRLVDATGEPAPNRGGGLRIGWEECQHDWPQLEAGVKRLIIPSAIGSRVMGAVVGDEDWSRVVLGFQSPEDWRACFPANEDTQIFVRDGRQAWAAVGLCENILGLAVFAQELESGGVQAKVQPVPEDVFAKLT